MYYTTQEVADYFRVTKRTVNRWVKIGKLDPPDKTPGGHNRWPRSYIHTRTEEK